MCNMKYSKVNCIRKAAKDIQYVRNGNVCTLYIIWCMVVLPTCGLSTRQMVQHG